MFIDIFNVLPRVKDGRVVALAATGKTRLKVLPDLMTAAESGLPGYDVGSWSGLWVRKGTPPEVVAFLNRMAKRAAEAEKEQVEAAGGEVFITTQADFARYIESEVAMWKKITTIAKIVPE
jgi:tripartite-type tricarboxylate transporter receptor subunit TctC